MHQSAFRLPPTVKTVSGDDYTSPLRLLDLADRLDRRADMELAHGRAAQAERLAHLADELRNGGLAHG